MNDDCARVMTVGDALLRQEQFIELPAPQARGDPSAKDSYEVDLRST